MCRIENVEEIFELQPSLTIIKIDKQQRNDRGSNIRIKYITLIIDFIRTPPTFIRTCTDECGNPIP